MDYKKLYEESQSQLKKVAKDHNELILALDKDRVSGLINSNEFLQNKVLETLESIRKEEDNEDQKAEEITRLRSRCVTQSNEIDELRKENRELSIAETQYELKRSAQTIRLQKEEIAQKSKLLESYRELPDVKKLMNEISSMKMPSVESIQRIISIFDTDKNVEQLSRIETLMTDLIHGLKRENRFDIDGYPRR